MSLPSDFAADEWGLDPSVAFLNHGSFGACPRRVLEAQDRWRARLEAEPVRFMLRELEPALDAARTVVARSLGGDAEDFAFVRNATTGVNAVLRSLVWQPQDELLTTDHTYPACRNALEYVAQTTGARVVVAPVPFPLRDEEEVADALVRRVTPRTRLALVDHVTSPTGVVFPIQRIVDELARRGVDTLVDGAHAPGMVPVDLRTLGAAYYTANLHKWVCAPKGSAFLWVRRDLQPRIRPLVISHGATSPRRDRSRFLLEFDWPGTDDFTPYLAIPDAYRFLETLLPGGLPALMAHNRTAALRERSRLAARLGVDVPCPDSMIGSLAALRIPDAPTVDPVPARYETELQTAIVERHSVQAPIVVWPAWPRRLVRISAQIYNDQSHFDRLADALVEELARERGA